MDSILLRLLNRLDEIGAENEETYDTDCRELMGDAVFYGFVRPTSGYAIADEFGLFSDDANEAVAAALRQYVVEANAEAERRGLTSFHERLAAFQNGDVRSEVALTYFDDYFGWSDPKLFDAEGNLLG